MWRHFAARLSLHSQTYLYTMLPGKDSGTVHATGIDDGELRGSDTGREEKQYEPWSRQRSVASLRPVKVIR